MINEVKELSGLKTDRLLHTLASGSGDEIFIARVHSPASASDSYSYQLIYTNPAYQHRFGYHTDMAGHYLEQLIPGFRQAELFSRMHLAVSSGENQVFTETFTSDVTGEEFHYSTEYQLLCLPDGHRYLAGISRNVSHLNQQLKDLYELSENYRHMVLNSSNSIIYLRPDHTVILANKAAQDNMMLLTGQVLLPGHHILEYVSRESYDEAYPYQQQMEITRSMVVQEQGMNFPGGKRWFLRKYFPTFTASGVYNGFVISSTEITSEKNHLLRIEEQASALKSIAHMQSHQVRRPLANILSLLNLLKEESDSLQPANPEFTGYMQLLEESVRQLDEVVHRIVAKT